MNGSNFSKFFFILFACIFHLQGYTTTTSIALPIMYEPIAIGTYPGVIILHTSAGLYSHETDYAQMLAKHGYVAAVVNYFAEGGQDNIINAYDELKKNPKVIGHKIGVVGFSRGAYTGINQIAVWGESRTVDAIVSYYIGPSLNIPIQNLPPMLFLHGYEDNNVNPEKILQYCAMQKSEGRICEVELYENGKHAFDHPQARLGGYSEKITSEANKKALDFLDYYLKDRH